MSCTTAEDLTHDLWVHTLHLIPSKQRLSACALVCRKLARAAAAATQSVELDAANSPERLDAFLSWFTTHGSSLTHLDLRSTSMLDTQQLLCPNLVELKLTAGDVHLCDCSVQLCDGSEGLGLLSSCPALTKLTLSSLTLLDGDVAAPAGGAPTEVAQLQHLHMNMVDAVAGGAKGQLKLVQALEGRLFPHLTSLTCLDFMWLGDNCRQLQSCFLEHVSSMVRLRSLRLVVQGTISTATLPGIERLTALQDLSLAFGKLEPSCLLPMTTSLTRLCLEFVSLQPHQAQQDSALGAAQLLQLLAQLTALQVLRLSHIGAKWPQQQLSAHSALTASSSLQELQVTGCSVQDAAWVHVFPAGRKLPHLYTLEVNQNYLNDHYSSPDITSLVSCCPGLETLDLAPSLTASLAPLKSLTALTGLVLGPVRPSVVGQLAAVTQLQDLQLRVPVTADDGAGFGVRDLLPITALTGLTRLCSQGYDDRQYLPSLIVDLRKHAYPEGAVDEDNFAVRVPLPDVWVQLLQRCEADAASQSEIDAFMARLQLEEEES